MKLAATITTPEVNQPVPVALLQGDFSQRLEKAASYGYDGVELMVTQPKRVNAAHIREQTAKNGLEVAAIASGALTYLEKLTLLSADPTVSRNAFDRLVSLIQFAFDTGAPIVTIGSFRGRLAAAGEIEAREKLADILIRANQIAAEYDIRLVLEAINRYETDFLFTGSEVLSFINELGCSHLGLLLDTYHVNIEEPSISECFKQGMAAKKLWHIHLGDSNRLPPGQGHVDFPKIISTLREGGYQGYLSAELLGKPDPDRAAAETAKFMRRLLDTKPGQ